MKRDYPQIAVDRAMNDALDWLKDNRGGYPRSWEQIDVLTSQRGYEIYDDFDAPPIAGYEALERKGLVTRLETVGNRESGSERIHFRLKEPPR
jgi:hypothetical protein